MFLIREHLPDGREASPGTRGYGGAAPPQNRRNTSTTVIAFAAMLGRTGRPVLDHRAPCSTSQGIEGTRAPDFSSGQICARGSAVRRSIVKLRAANGALAAHHSGRIIM
jgi:hypothetical protein